MIKAQGLEKTFGTRTIVRNIEFEVAPGEVFGLLGPNGAGKTTTLRMLSTTHIPTRGRAIVAGHDVRHAPEQVRAHIGVLPTDSGLYGRLTAPKTCAFTGACAVCVTGCLNGASMNCSNGWTYPSTKTSVRSTFLKE